MKHFLFLPALLRYGCKLLFVAAGIFLSIPASGQLPTAQQVASQMKVGWNLGNTLEAICGENAWGNPNTSQALINAVKAAGFNTVRIPCAWDCHTSNGVIDAAWISRVKTVVDYCINNNMYVIINIHWDGGWLENNCTTSAQNAVNAKQQNYWTQIANYFKNYNERLLFASANEPAVSDATGMSVLLSYHQTFINAVRATGGNNSSRSLIIQGPSTSIDNTYNLMNTMPTDQISNRLMMEVHYHAPWQFCGLTEDASWGTMFYYWGNGFHSTSQTNRNSTWGEESEVERALGLMKTKYVDNGIPVIIGEFGAIKRSNPSDLSLHLASREYFNKYVTSSAKNKGMIPVYWDNGATDFGLFNRSTAAVTDQGVINAIMQGAGGSTSGYITLANRATGLLMDGIARTANGSNCSQWSNSGSYNQQWALETTGSYVKLKNRATGLYLDGMGRTTDGSIAGQWAGSSSNNQQWTMESAGGFVKFKNRATGLYLDGLGQSGNGVDLGQWSTSSSYNQQWTSSATANARTAAQPASMALVSNSSNDKQTSQVVIYPNPSSSNFNLVINDNEKIKLIEVVDINGRGVEAIKPAAVKNRLAFGASLQPNTYIIKVTGDTWTKSFKVIKQ
ncbi:cellulase family glycosylhydrolase [Chitinophaga sp. 22321]|uniref:Cellulase family glycosylhydrolase n=1 Tax=Chitinophaga hostae TaxID=2831022 RepID=A0ABS5J9B5_9BACT|nr:cellulase family glycosylhydrolase [Chitinophaga hostae]MBS0031770.1 cellulase family glycosylhydrolase [Chitinophaga hostae]